MLIRSFSIVIILFDSVTREFLFNRLIWLEVGKPVFNDTTIDINRYSNKIT